jgi:hypothetical protein
MLKKLLIIISLFVSPLFIFAQTTEDIYKEAYPEIKTTFDNSDYAIVIQNIIKKFISLNI